MVGDSVMVAPNTYSTVHAFSRRDADADASFVKLTTNSGTLMLTEDHYVYVNGYLRAAVDAKVG